MKKNRLLWLCAVLMMVVGMSSCSSDDVNNNLWGTWSVVGYGNDQDFHTGDNIVNTTRLTFHPDGTFDGNIWPNEAYGTYVRKGDLFSFTEIESTKLGGQDLDRQLIEEHIRETKSYKILSGSELRLYYDAENYVKFVKVK